MISKSWKDMQILVVEHHDKPSIGVVGETLHGLGVSTPTVWCGLGDPLPADATEHDGIIVLGGTMSAVDDASHPYLPALTSLIREFADADKPVLGICLGSQLIARAFGADIHVGGPLEFGFHRLSPTLSAESDPLMRHLGPSQALFQWHTDHYTLPAAAEHLAIGEHYENQSYLIGRAVYGMQFHFEVDRAQVWSQIADTSELAEQVPGYEDWLPRQFAVHEEASNRFCRNVTREWISLA